MLALTPFRRHSLMGGYDPFREFENLERRFFGEARLPEFRIDIREEAGGYILEADLPGYKKSDIGIELEGSYMTVRAERNTESAEETAGKYLRNERVLGSIERIFDISGVDPDSLHASYENGVLSIRMQKKKAVEEKKKSLPIE